MRTTCVSPITIKKNRNRTRGVTVSLGEAVGRRLGLETRLA